MDLDDLRSRLHVAEFDAQRALTEAATLGRLILNQRAEGPSIEPSLHTMAERLEVLRRAVHDMERAHASLRSAAHRARTGQSPAEGTPRQPPDDESKNTGCLRCHRDDMLVDVRVCARCSGLGAPRERGHWAPDR